MYSVVEITFDSCYAEVTLFRSANVSDCWEYIRVTASPTNTSFTVKNNVGQFMDPPADIISLMKSIRIVSLGKKRN